MRNFLALSFVLVVLLALASCDGARGSLPSGGATPHGFHVGAILNSSGAGFMRVGIATVTIAILAFGASFFTAFIPERLRSAFLFAAEIGGAMLVIGAGFVWLGEYPYLIAVIYGLVGLALVVRFRMYIARWLHLPATPAAAPVAPAVAVAQQPDTPVATQPQTPAA